MKFPKFLAGAVLGVALGFSTGYDYGRTMLTIEVMRKYQELKSPYVDSRSELLVSANEETEETEIVSASLGGVLQNLPFVPEEEKRVSHQFYSEVSDLSVLAVYEEPENNCFRSGIAVFSEPLTHEEETRIGIGFGEYDPIIESRKIVTQRIPIFEHEGYACLSTGETIDDFFSSLEDSARGFQNSATYEGILLQHHLVYGVLGPQVVMEGDNYVMTCSTVLNSKQPSLLSCLE